MYLIPLIQEVLLVYARPFIVLWEVVQLNRMYEKFWILESIEAFSKFVDPYVFTWAFLQIMHQVHLLIRTHDGEENFVVLIDHDVSVVEEEYLLRDLRIGDCLIIRRLMMNWLIKIIHAENGPRHFFVVSDILLRQKILIR